MCFKRVRGPEWDLARVGLVVAFSWILLGWSWHFSILFSVRRYGREMGYGGAGGGRSFLGASGLGFGCIVGASSTGGLLVVGGWCVLLDVASRRIVRRGERRCWVPPFRTLPSFGKDWCLGAAICYLGGPSGCPLSLGQASCRSSGKLFRLRRPGYSVRTLFLS